MLDILGVTGIILEGIGTLLGQGGVTGNDHEHAEGNGIYWG